MLAAGWLACAVGAAHGGEISPDLQQRLAALGPADEVRVIVQLVQRENLGAFRDPDRRLRRRRLVGALKALAARTGPAVESRARDLGARNLRRLWSINAVAVTLPAANVQLLASHPAVQVVRVDHLMQAPPPVAGSSAPPSWNIEAVQAPGLWALGHTGQGVVVASLDSGVDVQHPDLMASYRGGANSWYDPNGQHATPYDASGHGTQTMGIMVGGSASGTAIGVAPDARWIAVKQYDDAGQTNFSTIHLGFQWLLDPDLDTATDDAPDVVNASWGFADTVGLCITEFEQDVQVLRTAGIAVVFAGGNAGPAPASSLSPANNLATIALGAVDSSLSIAGFSSRGPSACDGSIYPSLVAPGVSVLTSDLSFGGLALYANVDGTSYAAPHAAGTLALLVGAFPAARVDELEAALRDSALDLGVAGDDNSYGSGLVNALGAHQLLLAGANTAPQISSAPVTVGKEGVAYAYVVQATDAEGDAVTFSLADAPSGMTIDPTSGAIGWTPTSAQVGPQGVTVHATDVHGLHGSQSFTIMVAAANERPVARADGYQTVQRTTLTVGAPGVLGNDSDADGDPLTAQRVGGPSNGTLVLNANGAFRYVPAAGFVGTDSFTYRAQDPGGALSDAAVVSIKVQANRPPVLAADSFAAPVRRSATYSPRLLPVLANDVDPDSAINPANTIDPPTLAITQRPDRGGTATVITGGPRAGQIAYQPKVGFVGTETLAYRVRDTFGALSNTAKVRITVTRN